MPPVGTALAVLVALAGASIRPAAAQEEGAGWDVPRVRRIVRGAIEARKAQRGERALRNFRAEVQGHVFYVGALEGKAGTEGPEGDQIVRADQVALEVLWQAPGRSRQTLVGRRSERRLPTSIQYHIDHLTLVLNSFGDRIRLGEGTEVRGVLHPAAPGALEHYRYRLADSLRMRVAGREATVYRVEVRPRDSDAPGVIGLMDVDPEAGAVVRLHVTFTPASYRDPELERIELDLRSALWHGRWWLPAVQEQTVARRMRWLQLPLSGVIRTRLRVTDLEANLDSFPWLPPGHDVVTLPEERLHAFRDWASGLYESPVASGAARADAAEARAAAREALRGGVGEERGLRPALPALSELARARRGEGARLGLGARVGNPWGGGLDLRLGHPVARGGLSWGAAADLPLGSAELTVEGYGARLSDIGPWPGASGLVSTFGYVVRGEDFTDPYFRDGAAVGLSVPGPGGRLGVRLTAEHHEAAHRVSDPPGDDPVRPVRPVAEGEMVSLGVSWETALGSRLGARWRLESRLEGAARPVGDFGFTSIRLDLTARSRPVLEPWSWEGRAGAAALGGSPPPQRLLLLGGRGTVPGWGFRRWGGDRAAWLRVEAGRDLAGPWLRLRAIGAAGWSEIAGAGREAAATLGGPWGGILEGTGGVRASAGLGIGLVDGLLRVDAVRGFDGGRWEWMVSVDPRFWELL